MTRPGWLTPGDWRPVRLPISDVLLIAWTMITQALIRGWDYGTGVESSKTLAVIENAAPLWVWSAAFMIGAAILLVGVALRCHSIVWLGHGSLMVAYATLAVGLAGPALASVHPGAWGVATIIVGAALGLVAIRPHTDRRTLSWGTTTAFLLIIIPTSTTPRAAAMLMLPLVMHALTWWRTGPRPSEATTYVGAR